MDCNANTIPLSFSRARRATRAGGFSLVELLVVIGIIVVLASLLLAAIGTAREKRKVVLATTQIKEIYAALQLYYEELRSYPPDTGNYAADDTSTEPYSLHRYLGMRVVDEMGNPHGPFLTIEPQFLKGPAKTVAGSGGVMLYCDPWGHPYQMDALHIVVDPKTGAPTRIGEPWPAGTPDNEKTVNVKVWSNGPDGKSVLGSLTPNGQKGSGADADNINSWTN
jgi:prepilin-type N-terminal cleavage/methylation domain-containing protein